MGFATSWLEKRALFPKIFEEPTDKGTGIIVVVPAFNEPDITILLNSLSLCGEPECKAEVIIIVNARQDAGPECISNNKICIDRIESWKKKNNNCFFRLLVFDAGISALRDWGAGMARKTGMDEALRRFDEIDKPDGVIVSLDADCTVAENYFISICDELLKETKRSACSIYFEHLLEGDEYPEINYRYITLYELHMRYYARGLNYSGFPYPFHTIGSALAVKAFDYMKAGGMNRRRAGEDFYFIQKLVSRGAFFSLNSTTVYPSPRTSSRAPFGTGAAMTKFIENPGQDFLTYNINAFRELRSLFKGIDTLFGSDSDKVKEYYRELPEGLRSFIGEEEWLRQISEIKANTSGAGSFRKRFFGWFNMFMNVRYMNHVHSGIFNKQPITEAAVELLLLTGISEPVHNPYDVLMTYRRLERGFR
jgi:hypothetical protein